MSFYSDYYKKYYILKNNIIFFTYNKNVIIYFKAIIINIITFNLNKAEKKVIINVPEKFRNFFKLIIKRITGKLLLYYLYNYIIDFIIRK